MYNFVLMTEDAITLDGLRLHFRVEGQGPDVLFVHGWASSRRMWAHLTPHLAPAYRCWALDLPGFGDSDKPAGGWYSIANYTALIASFLRAVGVGAARLVGHSMGGMIALDLAASYPEQVERLVAINPVVTGDGVSLRRFVGWGPGQRLLDWSLRLTPLVLLPALSHPVSGRLHHGATYLRRRVEDLTRATADSLWHSGRATVSHELLPRLAHITAPTLMLLGQWDLMLGTRGGRLAAGRIARARLVVLRAGHMLTDDSPAETIHHLQGFLA